MADSKKFVASFLVLAAIASSLAFILSGFSDSKQNENAGQTITADNQPSQVPSNAFIEQIPQNSPISANIKNAQITDADLPPVTASTNLTENFAQNMTREVIRQNPDGPQVADDGTGNPGPLQLPDASNLYGLISQNPGLKDVKIPNWDDQLAQIQMKTIDNYTQEDLANYDSAINRIVDKYFVNTNMADVSVLSSVSGDNSQSLNLTSGAISEIAGLKVPKSLASFQKNFIKLLVYQKNGLNLLQVAETDPMKASLILQAHDQKYAAAMASIQNELQKIKNLKEVSFGESHGLLSSVWENTFGVKKAHAIFFSIVFDPTIYGRMIWEQLKSAILQILKNTLVSMIQNQITRWISGDFGKPQFITNWRSYLSNTYNQIAGAAIDQVVPGLCQPFQLRVQSRLKLAFGGKNVNVSCTLDRVLGNINNTQSFFNNFANGGWRAYGATILPSGNEEGNFIAAIQKIDKKATVAQEAEKTKAIAGQGYKGTGKCKDGSDPNGIRTVCLDDKDNKFYPNADGSCAAGLFPSYAPNSGSCADGSEPVVTTPGTTSAKIIGDSANSSVQLIVNANDIIGIAVAAAKALISRLTSSGSGGLSSTGTGEVVGSGSSGGAGGAGEPTLSQTTCSPTTQATNPNIPAVLGANGGDGLTYTWSAPGGTPASGTGPTFTVSFPNVGTSTVSVTGSDGITSNCEVSVQPAQ